jgi:lipoate-protein ligase A
MAGNSGLTSVTPRTPTSVLVSEMRSTVDAHGTRPVAVVVTDQCSLGAGKPVPFCHSGFARSRPTPAMRLLRGRAVDYERDYERTREMVARVAADGEPDLRCWTPHRQVAFGRRDRRADDYAGAHEAAVDRGYAVLERDVGGRAVAYTGATVAFALAEPTADGREGIAERYDRVSAAVGRALASIGVDASEGEPPESFCPGAHSLQADGKLVGIAQRVRRDVALTAGVVVVRDREAIAAVLDPVYDALGVPFDPESVGSVANAGGDPDAVVGAVESELVGGRSVTARERIRDT